MKKKLKLVVPFALLLAAAPLASQAAVFFSDDFTTGSTLNQTPAAPSINSASYQTAIGITNANSTPSLSPGELTVVFPNTSSVLGETFARFSTTPIALTLVGDYIDIKVVFVNTSNVLSGLSGAGSTLNIGLYNSGGVDPNQGQFQLNTAPSQPNFSGGTEDWLGYFGRIFLSGNSSILTRPAQTPNGTTSQNQDLLFSNASGSQAFNNPAGAGLGNTVSTNYLAGTNNITFAAGTTNTVYLKITLTAASTVTISNALFAGAGTGGGLIFAQEKTASGANFLTSGFDGLAVGWRMSGTAQGSAMGIRAIEVTGQSTGVSAPPDIVTQPVPVVVPSGATCAFWVVSQGFNMTYQWHRYGTNLSNGGNIAGATSDTLVISPATAADVASGANGYYVTVTGTGGYSTNSTTNSLTLGTAKNLVWSGSGNVWDLNASANWLDPINPATFNFGDAVTFDNTASGGIRFITLTGKFLSASSVTVDSTSAYTFTAASTGSFAGPGQLIYKGANQLTIGNVNTHTGGTIVSNATAYLLLQNYGGLGTGPLTLAKAGGQMEIAPNGSASVGISGNVNVTDDFAIQFDSPGTFSGVLLGNLSGTAGKALTLNASPTNSTVNQRIRVYGANSTCDADLVLNSDLISFAPYQSGGIQIYNGVISGLGGLIQRGSGLTVLNGQNTYSGGTIPSNGSLGFGANTVGSVTSGPIGTGPLFIATEVGSTTGNGIVLAWGGPRTIANPLQYQSATNNLTFILGGTNALTFSGPFTLNGNDGLGTLTNRILQGDNTNVTTFSGVISDGGQGFGIIKTGSGIVAFSNTETYTGPTTVSNGTLRINGALNAASIVTVATNGILGGTGAINGPVTVQPYGSIAPGASLGTLTINNNLTLAGNLNIELNKSASPTSDRTVVSGTLANSGTGRVTVSNLGPALAAGDKFFLFNKAITSGNTLTVSGAGAYWQNDLAVDGSITVRPLPVITAAVPGVNNITLSGINGIAGGTYYVLASTNVATALTSWTTIQTNTFGVGGSFTTPAIPVTAGTPTRFFTLQVP